jgi:hypothetical protein
VNLQLVCVVTVAPANVPTTRIDLAKNYWLVKNQYQIKVKEILVTGLLKLIVNLLSYAGLTAGSEANKNNQYDHHLFQNQQSDFQHLLPLQGYLISRKHLHLLEFLLYHSRLHHLYIEIPKQIKMYFYPALSEPKPVSSDITYQSLQDWSLQ